MGSFWGHFGPPKTSFSGQTHFGHFWDFLSLLSSWRVHHLILAGVTFHGFSFLKCTFFSIWGKWALSYPYPIFTFWPFFHYFWFCVRCGHPRSSIRLSILAILTTLKNTRKTRFSGFGPLFSGMATLRRWIWAPYRMTGRPSKMTFLAIFDIFAKMPFLVIFLKKTWFWTSFCHEGPPQSTRKWGFCSFWAL